MTIERGPGQLIGDEPMVKVPFDALAEARLVLTDDLVRDALRRDKKARQEAKKNRRHDSAETDETESDTDDTETDS